MSDSDQRPTDLHPANVADGAGVGVALIATTRTTDVVYARQPLIHDGRPSVFLVGPTPQADRGGSWRPDAIAELTRQGFEGIIYSPEQEPDLTGCTPFRENDPDQLEWDHAALAEATVILAHVPRDLTTMPAMTTNIEWGMWWDSGKIVLGSPTDAPGNHYLEWTAARAGVPISRDIKGVARDTLTLLAARLRQVQECSFCRIASFDPQGQVLHRSARSVVIEPRNPVTPGHRLVIPVQHVADATTDPAVTGQTMKDAAAYAATLGHDCNIVTSVGAAATQTAFHLHAHVVPRSPRDGLRLPWDARQGEGPTCSATPVSETARNQP
ncbi:MAG: HIT domain-containing protein [Humibacillus sp.]|nr:HIT domain-containing protein [Humibacillus sp.]MDN5780355.1 HIT domain-containing protein [Humibacillus sp.]